MKKNSEPTKLQKLNIELQLLTLNPTYIEAKKWLDWVPSLLLSASEIAVNPAKGFVGLGGTAFNMLIDVADVNRDLVIAEYLERAGYVDVGENRGLATLASSSVFPNYAVTGELLDVAPPTKDSNRLYRSFLDGSLVFSFLNERSGQNKCWIRKDLFNDRAKVIDRFLTEWSRWSNGDDLPYPVVIFNPKDSKDGDSGRHLDLVEPYLWSGGFLNESKVLDLAREVAIIRRMGDNPGFMFHGSPGTGKTSMACSLGELIGRKTVVVPFNKLNNIYLLGYLLQTKPSTVIIDEVDKAGHEAVDFLYTLINQLKKTMPELVVILIANKLNSMNPALLRPERAGVMVAFNAPDEQERVQILVKSGLSHVVAERVSKLVPEDMTHDWIDKLGRRVQVYAKAKCARSDRLEDVIDAVAEQVTTVWCDNFTKSKSSLHNHY